MSTVIDHLQVTTRTQRLLGRGLQVVAVLGGVIALVGEEDAALESLRSRVR